MNRERIVRIVLNDLKRSKEYFENTIEPALIKRRDIYRASKEYYAKKFPELSEQSDYVSYDFYAYVQWAKPTILNSFFGPTQVVSIVGQGAEDAENADLMNKFVNWQLNQQCRGYLVYDSWIQDALIYELGILKCWWRREMAMKQDPMVISRGYLQQLASSGQVKILSAQPVNIYGDVQVVVEHQTVVENRPMIDHVSPFDLRWSPDAKSLETASFVAQRKVVTADELLRGVNSGIYDKKETEAALDDASGVEWTRSELENNPELDEDDREIERARMKYELYECYTKFDDNGDGLLEDMIVTIVGDHVLRSEPNNFGRIPFFVLAAHHDPDKVFCDISMSEISGEIQDLRTAMIRQLLVNISLNNNPQQYINEDAVNLDDINNNANYIRVTGDVSKAMVPVPVIPVAPTTMQIIEYFKSTEEELTGKTRYNQGTDADTLNKTATGIGLIMKASNQRINHVIKIFAETGVIQLYRHMVTLDQRFIDQNQVIRLFNEPLKVSPDDLTGEMDIVVSADVGLGEKEQVINTITRYLQECFPAAMQLGIADAKDFSRAAVELFERCGWKDAQACLRSPAEIEQMQRQQAQIQAQQQQIQLAQAQQGQVQNAAQSGAQAGAAAAMKQMGGM